MDAPVEKLKQFVRHYLVALQVATRLPVAGAVARAGAGPELAAASAPHLPGVGMLVGAAACVAFALAALLLPAADHSLLAAALLCTLATALLTGAAHEEGLAHALERRGAVGSSSGRGTLALLLVVGTKVALLAVLAGESEAGVLAALLAGHTVSRFWPLGLGYVLPFSSSSADPAEAPVDRGGLLVAALWCLPPLALMLFVGGAAFVLLALLASGLALLALLRHYRKGMQALSAHSLGAVQQVCEASFYLGAAFGLSV